MQKRVGLKAPTNPATGTYWRAMQAYVDPRLEKHAPDFVAVVSVDRKYARMGMQKCFVTIIPAIEYATNADMKHTRRIDYNKFHEVFVQITDEETLSQELGLAILASYA